MRRTLAINGHRIFVAAEGPIDGPPVVLLHHGLGAVRSWREQVPFLAGAGFRVIAYDRWGHGRSDARAAYAMPRFEPDLRDLDALLAKLGIEQPALVGHSDGGKIAMYYAAANPGRVTCLAIVSAHIYVKPEMAPGIHAVRKDFESSTRFQMKMRRVHGDKAESLFWGWYQGWTAPEVLEWDLRPAIKHITCPTLVVQGLEDEHIRPAQARELAASLPNASLFLLPGAGHMLPLDFPEVFNPILLEFLEKNHAGLRQKRAVQDAA
jgi:pimeloyl-ACP methyl ester carboxylesterase